MARPPPPAGSPLFRGHRIGLLGGSFNPAHAGHRHVSLAVLRRLGLDEVWWLVAPRNPLKPAAGMVGLAARLERARSVARHPRIRVAALEARLDTSFTIDTVRALAGRFPGAKFVWLMGADILVELPRWRHWARIFDALPVAVVARLTYDSRALAGPAARRFQAHRLPEWKAAGLAATAPPAWVFLHLRHHPASATAIRAREGRAPEAHGNRKEARSEP